MEPDEIRKLLADRADHDDPEVRSKLVGTDGKQPTDDDRLAWRRDDQEGEGDVYEWVRANGGEVRAYVVPAVVGVADETRPYYVVPARALI